MVNIVYRFTYIVEDLFKDTTRIVRQIITREQSSNSNESDKNASLTLFLNQIKTRADAYNSYRFDNG